MNLISSKSQLLLFVLIPIAFSQFAPSEALSQVKRKDRPRRVEQTRAKAPSKTPASIYSEDEKHKLFQAVGIIEDRALIIRVAQMIGIVDSSGQPKANFKTFVKEHLRD